MNVHELKRHLSPKLLGKVPGVTNVGTADNSLTVYIETDSEEIRERVNSIVHAEYPNVRVNFVIANQFRALKKKSRVLRG